MRATAHIARGLGLVLVAVVTLGPVTAPAVPREAVLKRGEVWIARKVPYSQSRYAAESGALVSTTVRYPSTYGWRTDCSGFVSMCLGLVRSDGTPLSLDTATLPGRMTRITKDQLQPGDLIVRPKTAIVNGEPVPYGHAVVFVRWTDGTKRSYVGYHESSGQKGAVAAQITYPFGSALGFSPYRYNGIENVRLRKSRTWYGGVDATAAPLQALGGLFPDFDPASLGAAPLQPAP